MRVLITGVAGFIGAHVAQRFLLRGDSVHGVDSINDYYNPQLKLDRLAWLGPFSSFSFKRLNIADPAAILHEFRAYQPDVVVHLAAQAGVRHSLDFPFDYTEANVTGTLSILEACRATAPAHLIYASSSSVYGANEKQPFSTGDPVDRPVSLYAATKRSCELMVSSYSHLFGIPATGLRFFTVYGPWGRPDMAVYIFTKAILEAREISVFADGQLLRDFTYIDDIVTGIERVADSLPPAMVNDRRHKLYNIGNSCPERVATLVTLIEKYTGRTAMIRHKPLQPGDVRATFADTAEFERDFSFRPSTPLDTGVRHFVDWYIDYARNREPADKS